MQRDSSYIQSNIIEKDNKFFTKEKTIIEFPKWYADKDLMEIVNNEYYIYGIFAIKMNNKYSVSIIPTLINTTPIVIKETQVNDTEYYQFIYNKNDCIINSKSVVKKELLSYNMFENFFIRAKVPWFLEYEDLIKIMDNLNKYAKSPLGDNYLATELVTSFIARSKKDLKTFYRLALNEDVEYIDLLNPYYANLNTVAHLAGGYFQENLVSAILNKEKEPSKLENLVRK